jgi:hypothetical protein
LLGNTIEQKAEHLSKWFEQKPWLLYSAEPILNRGKNLNENNHRNPHEKEWGGIWNQWCSWTGRGDDFPALPRIYYGIFELSGNDRSV